MGTCGRIAANSLRAAKVSNLFSYAKNGIDGGFFPGTYFDPENEKSKSYERSTGS